MYNDPEVRELTGITRPTTINDMMEAISRKSEDSVHFVIVRKNDEKVIGETSLIRMFPDWGTTDLSIIIPGCENRHQGYGTEAIGLIIGYALGDLNFNRISIGVVGFNTKALAFYEKVGFKKEGIQEQGYYYNYQYSDFIMMRILKEEYLKNLK
jgi:RimJ/RimL family protein N-acetyltransferase